MSESFFTVELSSTGDGSGTGGSGCRVGSDATTGLGLAGSAGKSSFELPWMNCRRRDDSGKCLDVD